MRATTPEESKRPIGTPSCGNDPTNPRFADRLHSIANRTEPPHSPPTPIPWTMRNVTSRKPAHTPIVLGGGEQPIAMLAAPINSRVTISVLRRPMRSP